MVPSFKEATTSPLLRLRLRSRRHEETPLSGAQNMSSDPRVATLIAVRGVNLAWRSAPRSQVLNYDKGFEGLQYPLERSGPASHVS